MSTRTHVMSRCPGGRALRRRDERREHADHAGDGREARAVEAPGVTHLKYRVMTVDL